MAANSNDSKPGRCSVAAFLAEHVLAHQGIEWKKSALASLAAAHLAVQQLMNDQASERTSVVGEDANLLEIMRLQRMLSTAERERDECACRSIRLTCCTEAQMTT